MSVRNNDTPRGTDFFGLLTIVFIVLKLTKVINWSWWWVLSPIWIWIVIFIIIFIIILIMQK